MYLKYFFPTLYGPLVKQNKNSDWFKMWCIFILLILHRRQVISEVKFGSCCSSESFQRNIKGRTRSCMSLCVCVSMSSHYINKGYNVIRPCIYYMWLNSFFNRKDLGEEIHISKSLILGSFKHSFQMQVVLNTCWSS